MILHATTPAEMRDEIVAWLDTEGSRLAKDARDVDKKADAMDNALMAQTHRAIAGKLRSTTILIEPREEITLRWIPMTYPVDGEHRAPRQFIRVEGWSNHTGGNITWHRLWCGIAWTRPIGERDELHGYRRQDIEQIMKEGDMDGIDRITHWMPVVWPIATTEPKATP